MKDNFNISIISTGDEGFNLILDENHRGIRNSLYFPVSVLLKGEPGSGKSTCALQLAQSYVRDYKTICVYYALEESPKTVQNRLQTFFGDKAPKSILAVDWNDSVEKQEEFKEIARKQGGIIFSRFAFREPAQTSNTSMGSPWFPFEQTMEDLPQQLFAVKKSIPNSHAPYMMVVDSFNALISLSETSSSDIPRQSLLSLLQMIRDKGFCSVFIFEKGSGDFEIEEYLVDVVIELGFSEDEKRQRYVRLLKARDHNCSPATHVMDISVGVGIQVYPNIKTASQALEGPIELIGTNKKFGITGLDDDFKNSQGETGLKPGSSTLLVGEPGTMNLPLGLSFLKNSSPDDKIMLMALEGEEFTINYIGRQILADKFEKAYKKKDCHVDVRYTSSSEFINDISVKIHRKDESDGHIDRLVLADLRMLFKYHQEETDEIIAYLLNLFYIHGITSVFVYTVSDIEEILNSSIADLFENIVVTQFFEVETSEQRYLGAHMSKYNSISVNRPLRELTYDFDSEPTKVKAERGVFRNLVEMQPGKVGFGNLTVRYYDNETHELNEFWNYMKSSTTELFPGEIGAEKLEFKPFSFIPTEDVPGRDAMLESITMGPTQARHTISEMLMFDEFWAESLIKRERLVPINEIDHEFQIDRYLNKEKYPAMLSPVLKGNLLYGIPLYGNCSLLVYNKGMLRKYQRQLHEKIPKIMRETGDAKGELKWEDIFYIIDIIRDEEPKLVGMYLDAFSGECASGFLVELLWGMDIINEKQRKILPENFLSIPVLRNLERWNEMYTDFAPKAHAREKLTVENIPNFIFSRMWYTRFVSLKAQRPELDLGVTRIPCLGEGTESAVSLSGNWYIGVLVGSVNEGWAAKLAKWLTSYRANDKIARKSIALPTYHTFWENRLVDREIADIYCNVKQRSLISNYVHIRPALEDACRKVILTGQRVSAPEIEASMSRLVRELQIVTEQQERGWT